MSVLTTGICDSFKAEAMSGNHCLNAVLSQNGTTHTSTLLDALPTTAGICRGMAITGGDVGASAFVGNVIDNVSLTMSVAASGSTTASRTFTGDALKLALVKVGASRTYDHTQTNIGTPGSSAGSTSNLGTDEVAASGGYSSGGIALVNTTPVVVSGTAVGTFSNVSWTSATISTTGAILYNNEKRAGAGATPINGRTISVHDFGGTQTVTSGTLTLVMPTADQTTGLLRIA
jgi:hypothetical protein